MALRLWSIYWLITPAMVAATATLVSAQKPCEPQWDPYFGNPGPDHLVMTLAVFDDGLGCGPSLYVGGQFGAVGDFDSLGMVKWDGQRWWPIEGLTGGVEALAVHDDGSGPALYVGGRFFGPDKYDPPQPGEVPSHNIAKWDGTQWLPLGEGLGCSMTAPPPCFDVGETVYAIAVYDDGLGGGPMVYAAGQFDETSDHSLDVNNIARWNGSTWSGVAGGLTSSIGSVLAFSLAVFDDGSGPALYVSGGFTHAGGVPALRIAKWNGLNWSPVGGGFADGYASALCVFDEDGDGPLPPALFAGGNFTIAGGVPANYIARWNGAAWTPVGGGTDDTVRAFAVFDDGSGPSLYVGGNFDTAGKNATTAIAKWDGQQWSPVGLGIPGGIKDMTVYNSSQNGLTSLYVGGGFSSAGGNPVEKIGRWGCSAGPPCLADVAPNCGDQMVGVSDILAVISEWGKPGGQADVVNDGIINVQDLLGVIAAWGKCP